MITSRKGADYIITKKTLVINSFRDLRIKVVDIDRFIEKTYAIRGCLKSHQMISYESSAPACFSGPHVVDTRRSLAKTAHVLWLAP